MNKNRPYRGMVLFTVLALLSIYFVLVFQYINFYRQQQIQLSQLVHFYEMKTLVHLSYRRVTSQKAIKTQTLTFNKGRVLFRPSDDDWCFEVSLNTGEKRSFYQAPPQPSRTEDSQVIETETETYSDTASSDAPVETTQTSSTSETTMPSDSQ